MESIFKFLGGAVGAWILSCVMMVAFALIWAFGFNVAWDYGVLPIFSHYNISLPHISYGIWVLGYLALGIFKLPFFKDREEKDQAKAWGKVLGRAFIMYVACFVLWIVNLIVF